MKHLYRHALSLACLAAATLSNAQANLLTNGSFETAAPGFSQPDPVGTSLSQSQDSALAGWAVSQPDRTRDIAWLNNTNIYNLTAADGSDFVDLTGYTDAAPYATLYQAVGGLVVGSSYRLSFDLGAGDLSGHAQFDGPVGIAVNIVGPGSEDRMPDLFSTSTPFTTAWTSESFAFTATDTTELLMFTGTSATGGQFIGLDDADLELAAAVTPPPPAGVPEPETWALLPVGLIGWIAIGRTRKDGRKRGRVDAADAPGPLVAFA